MSDWQELVDESSGKTYYYNPTTEETSWVNPNLSADDVSAWQALQDESGETYYFNAVTQETSWDKPEGFDDAAAATESSAPVVDTTTTAGAPASAGATAACSPKASSPRARAPRKSLAVRKQSVLRRSASMQRRAAGSNKTLDEQLASRARKYMAMRRIERGGGKPAAFAALARRRGLSTAAGRDVRSSSTISAGTSGTQEWQEVVHEETGQTYYYNPTTEETSWEKPT